MFFDAYGGVATCSRTFAIVSRFDKSVAATPAELSALAPQAIHRRDPRSSSRPLSHQSERLPANSATYATPQAFWLVLSVEVSGSLSGDPSAQQWGRGSLASS